MATEGVAHAARGLDRRKERDRRAHRSTVHLPERRLGFDRRTDPTAGPKRLAYLGWIRRISESSQKTAILMASIVVLAIADMAFTFAALDRGLEELNPVMVFLLDAGHGVAAFVKVGITVVLAAAGWRLRRFRKVIEVGLLVFGIMALVNLYHLLGLLVA